MQTWLNLLHIKSLKLAWQANVCSKMYVLDDMITFVPLLQTLECNAQSNAFQ